MKAIICIIILAAMTAVLALSGEAAARIPDAFSNGFTGFAWSPQSVDRGKDGRYSRPSTGDPITLIFTGGGAAGTTQVASAMANDWDSHAKSPAGQPPLGTWRNHTINPACVKHKLFVTFTYREATLRTVGPSFTGSTSRTCLGNQYHARFWSDRAHAQQSGQPTDRWTIAASHHDHLKLKGIRCRFIAGYPVCYPVLKHTLDVPWDLARTAFLRALHSHCNYRIWHVNKAARQRYQNFRNSGRISRISMYTGRPCDGR